MTSSGIHHVDVWVADIETARGSWGWLLPRLGFTETSSWTEGTTWAVDGSYLTLTWTPTLSSSEHDRRRPGMNHLAFHGGSRSNVDELMSTALAHGWRQLYADRYPHAGGPDHYAGWLEDRAGFKVEIVAAS